MRFPTLPEVRPVSRDRQPREPQPFRFTVEEYHRMAEVGIFGEDDRVELLDGELVTMSPIGPRHAGIVADIDDLLGARAGERAIVWPQNPLVLDDRSEPQPDLLLLPRRPDRWRKVLPRPEDVLLAVEVGDSSARFDERVKAPLYARARVRELWLVDVEAELVTVCRKPDADGLYSEVRRFRRGERLEVEALPGVALSVDEALGPVD